MQVTVMNAETRQIISSHQIRPKEVILIHIDSEAEREVLHYFTFCDDMIIYDGEVGRDQAVDLLREIRRGRER